MKRLAQNQRIGSWEAKRLSCEIYSNREPKWCIAQAPLFNTAFFRKNAKSLRCAGAVTRLGEAKYGSMAGIGKTFILRIGRSGERPF